VGMVFEWVGWDAYSCGPIVGSSCETFRPEVHLLECVMGV